MSAETIKTCCADVYASEWVRMLLGDSMHPGGLVLTERLGVLLGLEANSRVLDVAAGRGTSALHLARRFGCHVLGIDYSSENIGQANEAAQREGLADKTSFLQADAEQLGALRDSSFDAVICECAYCTFPNKRAAAAEIARVLAPEGRFGLSDLTRNDTLPSDLNGLVGWVACIADAQSVPNYVADLESAGLQVSHTEAHAEALAELIDQVRGRLLAAQLATKIQQVQLPVGMDLQLAGRVARSAAEAVKVGSLGYTLLIASGSNHGLN